MGFFTDIVNNIFPPPTATPPAYSAPAPVPVDVEAALTQIAADKGDEGNWRDSIVDLLKLLDLD